MIDEVRITRPCPERSSGASAARTLSSDPFTLVPKISSMSCSVMSARRCCGKMPALAQSTSRPPFRSTAVRTTRSQSALVPTSPCAKETVPASPARSSTARAPATGSRPVMTTFAPAPAKTRAMPFPMPFVPPVTRTERSVMGVNMRAGSS